MAYGTVIADVMGTSVPGSNLGAGDSTMLKNRIINGAMVIDQRDNGASVTPATGAYTLDRWQAYQSTASKFSVQQNAGSVTPPAGFTNYLGVTSLSAYSVSTGDYYSINQGIEGFNIADLAWGTANAKTITLSFWVYSSLTGTFGGAISNTSTRSYPFTYTISSANTWQQISITISGDTTGTWATNNSVGIAVRFGLGVGSTYSGTAGAWAGANYVSATGATSVVGTNGATFYITGVQLEVGSSATGFEYRQYQQELALCQRYYYQNTYANGEIIVGGVATSSSQTVWLLIPSPATMRAKPTGAIIGTWAVSNMGQPTVSATSQVGINIQAISTASGQVYAYNANIGNGYTLSAEL